MFTRNRRTVPFASHIAARSGKEMLQRDRERAQKFMAGIQPHGPLAMRDTDGAGCYYRDPKERDGDDTRGSGSGDNRTGTGRAGTGAGGAASGFGTEGAGTGTGGAGTGTGGAGTGTGGAITNSKNGDEPTPTAGTGVDGTDAGVAYTASVLVGSPPTQYTLLVDSCSSNTWVGADKDYVKTSTSKSTGEKIRVSYGSGSFFGKEFMDTVALASELVIKNQLIGVASSAQGCSDVDGVLGIASVDLRTGSIPDDLFGISYEPASTDTDEGTVDGELTFGGTDSLKYVGDINFTPITTIYPASKYWSISQDVSYGSGTKLLSSSVGDVDMGTTLLLIATDAFQAYQQATGATFDITTGLLTFTKSQYENLQSIFFTIGNMQYELTANAQIWPRWLNSMLGGEEDKIYGIIADIGIQSGSGLDFISGFVFLQRFYTVFDSGDTQIGFANTPFTKAATN